MADAQALGLGSKYTAASPAISLNDSRSEQMIGFENSSASSTGNQNLHKLKDKRLLLHSHKAAGVQGLLDSETKPYGCFV